MEGIRKPDCHFVSKLMPPGLNTFHRPPKFNSLVKKFGYKYEKGVLTGPEDCEAGVPTKRVDHGKEGGKNQRAMLVTPKKRKTSGMFEEDEMAETKNDVRGEGMRQKVKQEKLA